MYVLNLIANLQPDLAGLAYVSIFHYFAAKPIIDQGAFPTGDVVLLGGIGLAGWLVFPVGVSPARSRGVRGCQSTGDRQPVPGTALPLPVRACVGRFGSGGSESGRGSVWTASPLGER